MKYYKKENSIYRAFLPKASCCHFAPYIFVIVSRISLKKK